MNIHLFVIQRIVEFFFDSFFSLDSKEDDGWEVTFFSSLWYGEDPHIQRKVTFCMCFWKYKIQEINSDLGRKYYSELTFILFLKIYGGTHHRRHLINPIPH